MATIKSHDGNKIAPILSAGTLSPALVLAWQSKAQAFFTKQKVPVPEQVSKILDCFHDDRIVNWVANNRPALTADDYNFTFFMKKFRELFLDPDWENDIVRSILNAKMPNDDLFSAYANRVIAGNNLLRGTESCLDEAGLKNTLTVNMAEPLAVHLRSLPNAERARLLALEFQLWIPAIMCIDNTLNSQKRLIIEVAENLYNKRQRLDNDASRTYHNNYGTAYASGANTISTQPHNNYNVQNRAARQFQRGPSNTASLDHRERRCPALTDDERRVLARHDGCFKCRMPYVPHITRDCPTGFPSADNYETHTDQWCECRKPRQVAAIHQRQGDDRQPRASTSRAHIDLVPQMPPRSSIAVLPSVNFVLEGDNSPTLSPSPSTNGQRDDVSPFFVPHFKWKACYFSTASEFPVAMDSLIDNACPYVLIRPDIVIDLGLTIRKLKKPFRASSAFSTSEVSFNNYVIIQPFATNNSWTSKPIRVLVADKLCSPLILGLPFLQHNELVIDYKLRTIIDKKCDFNLLDENSYKKAIKPKASPHQKRVEFKNYRKQLLVELKWKCAQRRLALESNEIFEEAAPPSIIAAITTKIEQLASKDKLSILERSLKEEYKDIFEPIPHANLLPTNYTARIRLKDAEKTILTRSYTCPRQFKEAFARLIDQRLESGFIRRSTSQHLSPSFIIPKADPKAMPRWVCDYRQLNANTVPNNYPLPNIDEILTDCATQETASLALAVFECL